MRAVWHVTEQPNQEGPVSFSFNLDKNDPSRLEWWDIGGPTELTNEEAMIAAVAGLSAALNNIAKALAPLQEIADIMREKD